MFSTMRQFEDKQKLVQELKALAKGPPQSELDLSPYKKVLTDQLLRSILINANGLRKLIITGLSLKERDQSKRFIVILSEHMANNPSLTSLTINSKLLTLRDIEFLLYQDSLKTLNLSHNTLRVLPALKLWGFSRDSESSSDKIILQNILRLPLHHLDLSKNKLMKHDACIIADILSTHPTLQILNLSDNGLGCNEGLTKLAAALTTNQSLTELQLDGRLEDIYQPDQFDTYTNTFEDASLIPFFNMLAKQKKLQAVSIAGYFTDQSAAAITHMLKENQTLTHLCINQHIYQCKCISHEPYVVHLSCVYMTNNAAVMLAEGIRNNRTLTSVHLKNMQFTARGFKEIADALEKNTTITTFEMNRALNPTHAERVSAFGAFETIYSAIDCYMHKEFKPLLEHLSRLPKLPKDELAKIHAQEIRIQHYITRNRALLRKEQPESVKNNVPSEVKQVSLVPLSLFSGEKKLSVQTDVLQPLLNLSSIIPKDASTDLSLKLMIPYYDNLAQHIRILYNYLDLDEESQREKAIISAEPMLRAYCNKLLELTYYFQACQSISTMLVAKQNDLQDMATSLAAATGRAVLDFIPVVSGLSCLITGLETVAHLKHDVAKHRFAIKLIKFTHGLGVENINRLVRRFARKITLINQHQIFNPKTALAEHSFISKELQYVREFREGNQYIDQQILALADLTKLLDAIITNKIIPPDKGTEEERFNTLLAAMLEFMKQEKAVVLVAHIRPK